MSKTVRQKISGWLRGGKPVLQPPRPPKSWNLLFKNSKWIFSGLLLTTVVAYANILGNDFVTDDIQAIVNNSSIADLEFNLLHNHPSAFIQSLLYQVAQATPFIYHLNSMLWHSGVTILIYIFLYLITAKREFSALTALLFALHPIHTEAVTWASSLPYLIYSFFVMLTLILVVAKDRKMLPHYVAIGAIIASSFIAFHASEKSLVLLPLVLVYVLLFGNWKKQIGTVGLLFLVSSETILKLFGLFGTHLKDINPGSPDAPEIYNPLIQIPTAIATYLKLLIWPFGLTYYHDDWRLPPHLYNVAVFATLLCIGIYGYLTLKNRKLLFITAFFIIGLAPVLVPVKIAWVVAERYVYFASLGFFAFLAFILEIVHRFQRTLFVLSVSAIVIFYAVLTIQRNRQWQNEATLWPATVITSPTSFRAHNNLGVLYFQQGNSEGAFKEYLTALHLNPIQPFTLNNLANIYHSKGNDKQAEEYYLSALAIKPDYYDAAFNLGTFYNEKKDFIKAEMYYFHAAKIDPKSAEVLTALGNLYLTVGNQNKAREMWQNALAIDPDYQPAKMSLQKESGN